MELCDYLDVKGKKERRRKANIKISNSAMVKLGEELVSGIGNGSGEVRTLYTQIVESPDYDAIGAQVRGVGWRSTELEVSC